MCSSDLEVRIPLLAAQDVAFMKALEDDDSDAQTRSEERRVGKECRSRW